MVLLLTNGGTRLSCWIERKEVYPEKREQYLSLTSPFLLMKFKQGYLTDVRYKRFQLLIWSKGLEWEAPQPVSKYTRPGVRAAYFSLGTAKTPCQSNSQRQ